MSPNPCEFSIQTHILAAFPKQISLFGINFWHKYPLIWHSFNQWPWSLWRTYCFLECGQILSNCIQASKDWRRNRTEKSLGTQVSYLCSALIILIWSSIIRALYSAHGSMLNTRKKQLESWKQCTYHILSTTITLYFSCPQNIICSVCDQSM